MSQTNSLSSNDGWPFFEGLDRLEGQAILDGWSVLVSPVEAFLCLPPAISITCATHRVEFWWNFVMYPVRY